MSTNNEINRLAFTTANITERTSATFFCHLPMEESSFIHNKDFLRYFGTLSRPSSTPWIGKTKVKY